MHFIRHGFLNSLPCFLRKTWLLAFIGITCSLTAGAQKKAADSTDKITIQIINADRFEGTKSDSVEQTKLISNVHLKQGDNDMVCDSAYINLAANNVEAFGNVHITQPGGTQVQSDYLRYIGNKKLAYLKGNVKLDDGKNSLWSEDLTYDLGSKTAVYENGGTLQAEATTVSSNKGNYNVNSKAARFTGEVIVTDPSYNTTSEDLGYNTASKVVTFFGPSVVTNDKSTLHTSKGTYDTKNEKANFTSRTSLQDKEQYIEGDKIVYDRVTGFGNATGHVIAIDTQQHTTLWSGFAAYNEKKRTLLATIKPVLRQMNGKDSLFIRADTFFSAPDMKASVLKTSKKTGSDTTTIVKKGKKNKPVADVQQAEPVVDSTVPRYYIGYHHVRIFSDSLQGRCDSISYSEKDSVMKMMKDPVAWSRRSQITGDTILLYLDSSKINRLYVPVNALIVSQSGPDKAQLYDQIQGKTLTGHFKNNTITDMIVWPTAQSIYYAKDDSGAYIGVNQSESERMKVFFQEQKIQRILFEQEVKQTMTPMDNANLPAMRLSRFKWLEETRPKTREELFQ